MALLNYTTEKPPEESIGEIQKILSNYNVSAMTTEYEGRNVSAVLFRIDISDIQMNFKLPCNWRAVQVVLKTYNENRKYIRGRIQNRADESDEQAIRVAWRVIKDWVEAQMALVDINQATVVQVFLQYAVMKNGRTLAEHVMENPEFLLGDGK